jgi:hypothetical protein
MTHRANILTETKGVIAQPVSQRVRNPRSHDASWLARIKCRGSAMTIHASRIIEVTTRFQISSHRILHDLHETSARTSLGLDSPNQLTSCKPGCTDWPARRNFRIFLSTTVLRVAVVSEDVLPGLKTTGE